MKLLALAGARPQFIKHGALHRAAQLYNAEHPNDPVEVIFVNSGQHYDDAMSQAFLRTFDLPTPDVNLNVGSGTHGEQTGRMLPLIESVMLREKPDWAVVYGDTNTTLAGALAAVKIHQPIAHVEAGLRSFDMAMPEEVNRIVADSVADLLLITEEIGRTNLHHEGVADEKIVFTGNVMIDSLLILKDKAAARNMASAVGVETGGYLMATLHRPSNVDHKPVLTGLMEALAELAARMPVVFPVHPRTRKTLEDFGMLDRFNAVAGLHLIDPLDSLDFLSLQMHSAGVVTDSGGIQGETTYLGIPCATLRHNTEQPATIEHGTNELVGPDYDKVLDAGTRMIEGRWKKGTVPPMWDGKAGLRILEALAARTLDKA